MPEAHYSVTIQRPIGAVFEYVADGEKASEWRPGVLDITRLSGSGVGTTYRQGVKGPMGRRIAADYRITLFEPNRLLEFQTIAGPVRPRGRYEFESVGSATRLTFALQAELSGIRKLLMGSMVSKTMESEVRSLDRLKRLLEA